jgi:WD40 repeat protein
MRASPMNAFVCLTLGLAACGDNRPTPPRPQPVPEVQQPVPAPPEAKPPARNKGGEPVLHVQATKLETPSNHGGFHAFAFARDQRTLAGGTGVVKLSSGGKLEDVRGGEVVLWDAATGKLKQTLGGHDATVTWLAYAADGRTLASASRDNKLVKFWDAATGKLSHTLTLPAKYGNPNGQRPLLRLSPDGAALLAVMEKAMPMQQVTVVEGADLIAWDVATGDVRWQVPQSHVSTLDLSPDGGTLVGFVEQVGKYVQDKPNLVSLHDVKRHIQFWDARDGKPLRSLDAGNFQGGRLIFIDDKTLACADNYRLVVRDSASGDVCRDLKWPTNRWASSTIAFAPDGRMLGRTWSDYLELLDATTGKSVALYTTSFPHSLFNVTFAPDLKRAACNQSGAVVLDLRLAE